MDDEVPRPWQTFSHYRPFRKKRFVKGRAAGDDSHGGEEEHRVDDAGEAEAERAKLGDEVSSFYAQLTTTTPRTRSSSNPPPLKRPRSVLAISSSSTSTTSSPSSSSSTTSSSEAYYLCATCNDRVPVTVPVSEHTTSTTHLFHTTHKTTPAFGIPPNNVGYQMLLHKYDWEQDRGLGVECQGRLEPIATRLRAPDDRKGVGHEATLARPLRITHTKPRHGHGGDEAEDDEEEEAPLLPNEALALEEGRKDKGKTKTRKKNKRKRKEKREQKREREDLQRRRDQGVREAVYNEYPALIAPY